MGGGSDASHWDARYARYEGAGEARPGPCRALEENRHLLPAQGRALDLACGLGGNALLLARHGLETHGWDASALALQRLAELARAEGLEVVTEQRDVSARGPDPASFDVIVVSRFLDRTLCPAIAAALRPGGLLFYQTFTHERADPARGPQNPDYLLERNELLRLFATLEVVVYREEGTIGDTSRGVRDEAMLVARKGGTS